MGMVAPRAHHKGKTTSASSPSTVIEHRSFHCHYLDCKLLLQPLVP